MSNEIITADGEAVPATAPITLFGTDNPVEVVNRATTIAVALADVIKQRRLTRGACWCGEAFLAARELFAWKSEKRFSNQ